MSLQFEFKLRKRTILFLNQQNNIKFRTRNNADDKIMLTKSVFYSMSGKLRKRDLLESNDKPSVLSINVTFSPAHTLATF